MDVPVSHDEARHRFVATVEGRPCVADYQIRGKVMWMTHTAVPMPLEGRGIAAELVRSALVFAREHGLKVEPACSYVDAYMRRHPETDDLRAP